MSAVAIASQPAAALPEGKEFIRGWIVPNIGLIDYGQQFYSEEDRGAVANDSKEKLGTYFESRWDQYRAAAQNANGLFLDLARNSGKLASIAETAYGLNRDLERLPKRFPHVFASRLPIKSLKTREGLLYNYWRRPVEELYIKTAVAAHSFGNGAAAARAINILVTDFETDAIDSKTGKPTKNGFDASLRSYFSGYVEVIETLRLSRQGEQDLAQVYRAYGELMEALTQLVLSKYPEAKKELRKALEGQVDDRYDGNGKPTFGHTPCCFYARWNPNPGKTDAMEKIRGLVKQLAS